MRRSCNRFRPAWLAIAATEAAVSALGEVVERDAFTITWQARLAPPQIRAETLSDANYNLVERFERAGGTVTLLNLTLDNGIPTILLGAPQ